MSDIWFWASLARFGRGDSAVNYAAEIRGPTRTHFADADYFVVGMQHVFAVSISADAGRVWVAGVLPPVESFLGRAAADNVFSVPRIVAITERSDAGFHCA